MSIDISEPRKFYTPGSSISGNVTLNTAQDFAIGSVSLEFYGRVKGKLAVVMFNLVADVALSLLRIQPWSR